MEDTRTISELRNEYQEKIDQIGPRLNRLREQIHTNEQEIKELQHENNRMERERKRLAPRYRKLNEKLSAISNHN